MAFASDQRRLQSKFVTKMFTRNYSFAASFAFCDRQLRAWALLPGYEVWSVESEKRPSTAQKENQKNVKKREEHMKGSKCFTRADHFGLSMDEWKKRKDPPKKKRAGQFGLSTDGGCFMGFTWPPLWGVLLRATPFKPRIFGSGCPRSVFSSSQEARWFFASKLHKEAAEAQLGNPAFEKGRLQLVRGVACVRSCHLQHKAHNQNTH